MGFISWFQHREFSVVILTVLVATAVKTFAKQTNQTLICPLVHKCVANLPPVASLLKEEEKGEKTLEQLQRELQMHKFLVHLLEFAFTIFLIYLVSLVINKEEFNPTVETLL